jgi:hypothetical protein
MSIDSGIAAIIGAAVGGVFSSATAIITIVLNKRSEDRRHIQEVAVKVATEHYARFCQEFERVNPGAVLPPHMFDAFMVHIAQMVDVIGRRGKPTEETLRQSYATIQGVYDSMRDVVNAQRKAK